MSNTRRTTKTGPRRPAVKANSGEGRAIGLDDRDIPSGRPHLVNAESASAKPVVPERPDFPVMNAHGVEPTEKVLDRPEAEKHVTRDVPVPLPPEDVAVPVYQVERPGAGKTYRAMIAEVVNVAALGAAEPTRICSKDSNRVEILLLNEDSANDVRFSESQATVIEGRGAILPHGTTGYRSLKTQDEVFALSTAAQPVKVSAIIVTEVDE